MCGRKKAILDSNINKNYNTGGQFVTLYEKLREYEERFWRYFRMRSSYIQVCVCINGDTSTSVWHVEIGRPSQFTEFGRAGNVL